MMTKRSSFRQEVHTCKNWVKDKNKEMLPMIATHAIGSAQANENSFKPDFKTDRSYINAKQHMWLYCIL